jgi:dihydrofolate reductase
MSKVSIFIASSLDGYIAQPNDDLSFLKIVEKDGEDYGYANFIQNIEHIIIGRKTYDWVLNQLGPSWYDRENRKIYVITRTERASIGNVHFYTGNLKALIDGLKAQKSKGVFCDGGAEIINALAKEDLIDEYIISIIPILLGDGTRMFQDGRPPQGLKLQDVKHFDTGLVQLHYLRDKS